MSSYCLNEPFSKERWDSPTRTTKEHHCDATKKSQFNRKNLNMDELAPLCSNLFNVPPKTKVPTVASKLVR